MIADRFEIIDDGHLTIAIRHGANTLYIDELEDEFAVAAIRQQARDLEQLRTDLAAAAALTAARDETIADLELRLRISRQSNKELRESAERAERELAAAVAERDQLRAYKQAVDSAPVVARPKFIRGEICGCQTRPTHYVGEMDCPWHKRGDGQPKEAKD